MTTETFTPQSDAAARVRGHAAWGPVWAGAAVAVVTFLFLQMVFFALGWVDLGAGAVGADFVQPAADEHLAAALAGAVGFFAGGFTATATAAWRGVGGGSVHGLVTWTVAVLAIMILSVMGIGNLFGAMSDSLTKLMLGVNAVGAGDVQVTGQAVDGVRSSALWGALTLVLLLACAVVGGLLGARRGVAEDHSR